MLVGALSRHELDIGELVAEVVASDQNGLGRDVFVVDLLILERDQGLYDIIDHVHDFHFRKEDVELLVLIDFIEQRVLEVLDQ